jgi:hypothetical protein
MANWVRRALGTENSKYKGPEMDQVSGVEGETYQHAKRYSTLSHSCEGGAVIAVLTDGLTIAREATKLAPGYIRSRSRLLTQAEFVSLNTKLLNHYRTDIIGLGRPRYQRLTPPAPSELSKPWRKTLGVVVGEGVTQALAGFLLSHCFWAEEEGQGCSPLISSQWQVPAFGGDAWPQALTAH